MRVAHSYQLAHDGRRAGVEAGDPFLPRVMANLTSAVFCQQHNLRPGKGGIKTVEISDVLQRFCIAVRLPFHFRETFRVSAFVMSPFIEGFAAQFKPHRRMTSRPVLSQTSISSKFLGGFYSQI